MKTNDVIKFSAITSKGFRFEEIAIGLSIISEEEDESFDYFKPIEGLPFSGRIFSFYSLPDMVQLPQSMSPEGLAVELLNLREEARYDPPENPGKQKGWEIRKSFLGGRPVAIALAKWM